MYGVLNNITDKQLNEINPNKHTIYEFLKLLKNPFKICDFHYFQESPLAIRNLIYNIFSGDASLGMGRPKFLSDQLFNKCLLQNIAITPYESKQGPQHIEYTSIPKLGGAFNGIEDIFKKYMPDTNITLSEVIEKYYRQFNSFMKKSELVSIIEKMIVYSITAVGNPILVQNAQIIGQPLILNGNNCLHILERGEHINMDEVNTAVNNYNASRFRKYLLQQAQIDSKISNIYLKIVFLLSIYFGHIQQALLSNVLHKDFENRGINADHYCNEIIDTHNSETDIRNILPIAGPNAFSQNILNLAIFINKASHEYENIIRRYVPLFTSAIQSLMIKLLKNREDSSKMFKDEINFNEDRISEMAVNAPGNPGLFRVPNANQFNNSTTLIMSYLSDYDASTSQPFERALKTFIYSDNNIIAAMGGPANQISQQIRTENLKDIIQNIGYHRFNTNIVRNMFFISNVLRIIRLQINREFTQNRNILKSSHFAISPSITEYGTMDPNEVYNSRYRGAKAFNDESQYYEEIEDDN